ncbi:hypothetical protein H2248_004466 [Termitomyces sp. 'cryptogamus']|nr:hypothetical protein H2248_004466 [Termitomyces sp. 'cryptogamus']
MSTSISPIHELKTDDAIQKLRDSGDSEVADILLARYEELCRRSEKLSLEFQKDETTSVTIPEESEDTAEGTDSFEINLDHLEDGSLKFTLPPDEAEGKPKVYIFSSPNFDKKDPVHNIIIVAEEMAITAMNHIDGLQNLTISEMEYLTVICESLTSQKQKINSLKKTEGSPIALEVAAQLYLNDAFTFFQSVQTIVNANRDGLDESVA